MPLSEEQKEIIRKNREKALEIRKRKQEEIRKDTAPNTDGKRLKAEEEEDVELEEFEVGASELVTKTDAMKIYCLPEGTLAVCQFTEKENPKHKSWKPMKLYYRAEVRRRARERHGGIEGLVAERKKRAEKRFQKDIELANEVFKSRR